MFKMDKDTCVCALYGGVLLGGGGGGSLTDGLNSIDDLMKLTDAVTVVSLDELNDDDILINASIVGAPSAVDRCVTTDHWRTNVNNFKQLYGKNIAGIMGNENGGSATGNGWLASAVTGIPMVDAPSNGRAHPTGAMGAMTLSQMPEYQTIQCSCGGKGDKYLEVSAQGSVSTTSKFIRQTAVFNGGMSAVLRNPVTVDYVKKNAAVGGLSQAIEIGRLIYPLIGDGEKVLSALQENYDAKVVACGKVSVYDLNMAGGFDVGRVCIAADGHETEAIFWNEYMTLERDGERVATFPDLICTIDAKTGLPLPSADVKLGSETAIIYIPKARLKLGAGMFIRALFADVEEITHKEVIRYNDLH